MEWLSDPQVWASLATLTALEIVLGIDNIIFIAILANKLPEEQRDRARKVGLALGDLRLQGSKSARGDEVRTSGHGKFRQVGTVVSGILVHEGAAHFRITSSGS